MTVLGVLFGVFLALASRAFRVSEDPRLERVLEVLPGANCGACGYSGCRAYAEAVVQGGKIVACPVGGPAVAGALAEIMGVEIGEFGTARAVVHCQGGISRCGERCEYDGIADCRAAHIASGGHRACLYGCLGLGTCAEACPFGAISMNEERLPVIAPDKCTGCGICVRVCPRDLISLLDRKYTTYLGCSSRDSAKAVKSVCEVGCIACGLCQKKDPNRAIVIEDGLPVLDYEKAAGDFSVAAEACPMACFVVEQEKPAVAVASESPAGPE